MSIPIIDLFAGPGGLGEGFSSLTDDRGERVFKIKLSIEKDVHAHRTLELRAFFREFPHAHAPKDFYAYLAGEISREVLFDRHRDAGRQAAEEAWLATLGTKNITPALVDGRIRTALGSSTNWALIGGPPCQAYSLVGRSRIIGKEGVDVYDADPRHHLYEHYLRIIAVHRPPIFVMENVKGLLSAKVKKKGIFERILGDLRRPWEAVSLAGGPAKHAPLEYELVPLAADRGDLLGGFKPEDFVLHAEDYGVPQARHRIIILGIRSDLAVRPSALKKAPVVVTTENVINDLPRIRSGLSREDDNPETWRKAVREVANSAWLGDATISQAVRTAITTAAARVGSGLDRGGQFVSSISIPDNHAMWYADPQLGGVCNHESRAHMRADLHRYLFAAVFAAQRGRSAVRRRAHPCVSLFLSSSCDGSSREGLGRRRSAGPPDRQGAR